MVEPLHPTDDNLIEKLRAIRPEDRQAVVSQITRDWPKRSRLWGTVFEWLLLAMRLEKSPGNVEIAMQLGAVTERLRWVGHRVPLSRTMNSPDGATAEDLAHRGVRGVQQRRGAGGKGKRKHWAEIVAEWVGLREDGETWETIPDSDCPLEIETAERDLRIYRDGDSVVCVDMSTDAEVGSLAKSTFLKRYAMKAPKIKLETP